MLAISYYISSVWCMERTVKTIDRIYICMQCTVYKLKNGILGMVVDSWSSGSLGLGLFFFILHQTKRSSPNDDRIMKLAHCHYTDHSHTVIVCGRFFWTPGECSIQFIIYCMLEEHYTYNIYLYIYIYFSMMSKVIIAYYIVSYCSFKQRMICGESSSNAYTGKIIHLRCEQLNITIFNCLR